MQGNEKAISFMGLIFGIWHAILPIKHTGILYGDKFRQIWKSCNTKTNSR